VAEEDLRNARTRLDSALEFGAFATWTWDIPSDRVFADWNLARLFSVSPEDAAGGPVASYLKAIHTEDRDRVSGIIEQAIRSGARYEAEYRLVQPDGTFRWVVARGQPEYDDAGNPKSLSGVIVDITERQRAEAERTELAARSASQARLFDTALSNTPDFVYTFDLAGRFTYVNHALLALWQRNLEEAVGKDFFELDYPPELAERLQRQIRQVVETKASVRDETPFTSAVGTRHYEYIFVPVFAPDGTVEAVAGSTRDITERVHAGEATRRRAFQLQKLADIANRINTARDVNSVLGVVTEEARSLFNSHQAATSMVLDSHHPQPVNVVSNSAKYPHGSASPNIDAFGFYEAISVASGPIRLTRAEIDADPRWRTLAPVTGFASSVNGWLAVPLVGRNGRNMGLIQLSDRVEGEFTEDDEAILVQLSQLAGIAIENARLYQELRTNDERKDEFLAMLAHELRNPLAAIGNAVRLTARTDAREHLAWSMEVITRQMQHLSRLIDDLMDVSRITRGKIELKRAVMDVTPILESAAATVETLVEERKHTLETAFDRGNLWVNVDPTRLEQVVVNLLNNAAKYSENEGHILLSARNEGSEVVISVKDRGVGIPPAKLPEMFELFAQGDRSLARSEGGLGIGLTVVKKLVEMHGGSVVATSEGHGKGSVFVIRLPAVKMPSKIRPMSDGREEKPIKKVRILVVDDNADTAQSMAMLLKLIGHEVETASSGPQAIEVAKAYQPDFVLLDIGLPGMSGYEVASQLRKEESCNHAVIVAVSGYGQDEDRRRSKSAGFDFHLTKPLDHDALLTLLSAGNG
jgi:PAS domain S-box-containing protein